MIFPLSLSCYLKWMQHLIFSFNTIDKIPRSSHGLSHRLLTEHWQSDSAACTRRHRLYQYIDLCIWASSMTKLATLLTVWRCWPFFPPFFFLCLSKCVFVGIVNLLQPDKVAKTLASSQPKLQPRSPINSAVRQEESFCLCPSLHTFKVHRSNHRQMSSTRVDNI